MVVTAATPGVMGLASSTGINIDLIVRVLNSGGAITELKKIGNDTQVVQNKINNTTNQLGEQISITQNKLPKFQMQWLSMMFMGMQIQRTFGSFFQDAIKSIDKKIKAFSCYKSERRAYPHPRSPEALRVYAKKWGIQAGIEYGEPFRLIREIAS